MKTSSSSGANEAPRVTQDPFGLGQQKLAAQVGDFVLAPSRASLERAMNEPHGVHTFAYLGAHVEQVGETHARLRWSTAQRGNVPNELVIPITREAVAELGGVLLTATPGFGLERVLVEAGGTPNAPRVISLDRACLTLDAAQPEPVTLEKGTFQPLRQAGELGATLSCRSEGHVMPWILTAKTPERWLAWGFSGQVRTFAASECKTLPILPEVRVGENVFVPVAGEYVNATVRRVEANTGRVFVQHDFAAEAREHCVPLTQVARELP
ncbi:MAG TPA: hypothetical protein VFQ61_14265 [Polyangiaceae bacterium]|nr:hypothetical protein [Polyangiaceae bacterium]